MIRSLAPLLALALLVAACASRPPAAEPEATPEERAAYESARALTLRDPDAGETALREFLHQYPDGPLSDDAAMNLADLARVRGDTETAIQWLSYIVSESPGGDQAEKARLALARMELERGNQAAAHRWLERARPERMTEAQRQEAWRILASADPDPAEVLNWLANLRESVLLADPEAEALGEIDREIDARLRAMITEDLERAAKRLGKRIPAARVRLALARRALDAGDLDAAQDELDRASRMPIAAGYEQAGQEIARQIELREQIRARGDALPTFAEVATLPAPQTAGAHGTLGVVLPLTGPFSEYGEACLRGVMLAAGIFGETDSVRALAADAGVGDSEALALETAPMRSVRLVVRDSAGDPVRAAAAVRELADREDVLAIVGPMLSGESEAAAEAAQVEGVPLLTLTGREDVPLRGEYVFRLRTTPRDEVRHLVDYSVEQLGAQRFAILYPADNYGRGMRERFWSQVEAIGGSVVAVSSYDPESTDFADPIRRMIGYELLTRSEKKALEERADALKRASRRLEPTDAALARRVLYSLRGPHGDPLPPLVDFDVLFVPDSHDKVVLIAPQLAFHEISGVRLLGTGAWLHPDLVRIARDHVRGAVIAAPFDAESRFVFVSRFVERYTTTFGVAPDLFAAHAFDAANLVLVQLAAGRDRRDQIRDGVLRTQGYPGVSGVTTILSDGNARKRPYLLGVKGEELISLD